MMSNEITRHQSEHTMSELKSPQGAESNRAIAEVQASIVSAKQFPRDEAQVYTKMMTACKRKGLAETSMYAYRRGGTMVTGPSIRMAETLARYFTNLEYGIREIGRKDGESEIVAYCVDLETNVRQTRTFFVKHIRETRQGNKDLTSERDVYEHVYNMGARRLRACILGIIPQDIVEDAVKACEATLSDEGGAPLKERINKMVLAFDGIGVTQKMLEDRLTHPVSAMAEAQLLDMIKIFTSIRDGMSGRKDWFSFKQDVAPSDLNDRFEKKDVDSSPRLEMKAVDD
jgi:hypothetical protein